MKNRLFKQQALQRQYQTFPKEEIVIPESFVRTNFPELDVPSLKSLQSYLNDVGYRTAQGQKLGVTGVYDEDTEKALNQFKKDYDLYKKLTEKDVVILTYDGYQWRVGEFKAYRNHMHSQQGAPDSKLADLDANIRASENVLKYYKDATFLFSKAEQKVDDLLTKEGVNFKNAERKTPDPWLKGNDFLLLYSGEYKGEHVYSNSQFKELNLTTNSRIKRIENFDDVDLPELNYRKKEKQVPKKEVKPLADRQEEKKDENLLPPALPDTQAKDAEKIDIKDNAPLVKEVQKVCSGFFEVQDFILEKAKDNFTPNEIKEIFSKYAGSGISECSVLKVTVGGKEIQVSDVTSLHELALPVSGVNVQLLRKSGFSLE